MGDMGHFFYLEENLEEVMAIGVRKTTNMTHIVDFVLTAHYKVLMIRPGDDNIG
jgi:hypothetical protein